MINEFYFKYYNQLSNPFYFGYLIHLMTDQYWKTFIDPKYEIQEHGINGYRLKDGSFHADENWFGYFEDIKLQKMLAKRYNLCNPKVKFLQEHNYDLLIDNELRHIEDANRVGIDTILYGPFNPNYSGLQTPNWSEVESIIQKKIEERKSKSI